MTETSIRDRVARLFARGVRRSTAVAIEQELFALDLVGGAPVAPDRVRRAIATRGYARWVTFEPGGQVELSLPPAATPAAAVDHLARVTAELAGDLMRVGVVLYAQPVRDPGPPTPRYLRSPRYDAMERHFDTIGPAGRRMMRSTASSQVCLDWWPGRAGLEQWRVLLLAAPFLAAAWARSTGPTGRLTTWLDVDPSRTGFDDRLLRDDDPVAAYADLATRATRFVDGGAEEHLTTLFPPVRPRGRYLEVRFLDARPACELAEVVDDLSALLYDDARRASTLASLAGTEGRLAERWAAAAAGTLDLDLGPGRLAVTERGRAA